MLAGMDEHFYVLSITEFTNASCAEDNTLHREVDAQLISGIEELGACYFKAAQIKISSCHLECGVTLRRLAVICIVRVDTHRSL